MSVRSVGCLFCDYTDSWVIKWRVYGKGVKEAVSSEELVDDTNLMIVKRQDLKC